ncbi:hypothetical protein FIU89_18315 [Roseovarius sp. THAF27]|uniref:hypothetical protein n=1 Tax=Roseovarius TaxID=74030 RepID=UPI001267DC23|nr:MULTISPECIES: hypothetical protein [Roseovarius]MBY5989730.1 hypothetical protein [Roseovarius atlanticus]MBY6126275.1 hypothetical protein [Roseovarius atlanticus]MBY6150769.1 hypothetical protein [Roseovarius atlanticus]QFT82587.1 hypothetical protein FIU89_18315 [Roseovarius sp. THAF27]QFT98383.1 hypothetical protein FIU85_13805 [Roseovarius sp. THAF8]
MQELTLTKTRLFEGVWEGVITGAGDRRPDVSVTHLQDSIAGVEVVEKPEEQAWVLRVPIPADRIADGVQTFLISDKQTGTALGSFSIVSGDALAYDIRAEVTLLREELDMLKRAFRRHCLETM